MAATNAELLQRNEEYAVSHQPMPTIEEIRAMGRPPPTMAIITCADPRVLPEKLLGLNVGEALIFRTVAGHPQSALQDLAALDIEFHSTITDVMIIFHTDCGSQRFDVSHLRSEWIVRDATTKDQVNDMTFGAVDKSDIDKYIHEDVDWLRKQPLMRSGKGIDIQGYLYDIKSGKLRKVT